MTFQPDPRNRRFIFLNDFAVAAHRAVEPLQIAVDDENQVIQFLAHGHADRARVDSGSSISPSPRNAHTLRSVAGIMQPAF